MDADGPAPKVLLADKGYDAGSIRDDTEWRSDTAMIPTKRNRIIQLPWLHPHRLNPKEDAEICQCIPT